MSKYVDIMAAASEATGLSYDQRRNVLYGVFNGYTFTVTSAQKARYCQLSFYVAQNGNPGDAQEWKQIAKNSQKMLEFFRPAGSNVAFLVKIGSKADEAGQILRNALVYLTDELRNRGYENVCENCRQPKETDPCFVGNGIRFLCPDCFDVVSSSLTDKAHQEAETPENIAAGVVGALIGALLGAIVIVIFGQLGYVTALSGLIAAICALKGYELLAKKMSVKGAIIACVAMLIMVYVGNRADWAISAAKYFEVGFFTAFRAVPMLIEEGAIESAEYTRSLLMVYLFAIIGAVPTVINSIKGQKTKFSAQRLN